MQVDARKTRLSEKEAFSILSDVDEIYFSKGKKVVHINLNREKPGKEELSALLLGPTGNLRAPTLKKGRTLIVGFDPATYEKLFV